MAYSVPLFSTMNLSGVDINAATSYTLATATNFTPEYPQGGNLSLGTTVLGTVDGQWVYCTSATGNSKYDVVGINPSFSAIELTTAVPFGTPVGICMATATTGQYLWVMTNGIAPAVNVVTGIAANVQLYTSVTAGRLAGVGGATGAGFAINGIVLATSSTGAATTAGLVSAILIQPVVGTAA
jgi:hypothetical protein